VTASAGDNGGMTGPRGFYGRFRIRLDAKGRLTLPALYRRALGAEDTDEVSLVLRQGTENFVQVVPAAVFDAQVRSGAAGAGLSGPDRQWQKRMQLSSVDHASLDPKGRMTVPAALLERNGIGREVLVLGVGRLMEIWDPDTFFALEQQKETEAAAVDDLLYD
jgi:MraZ protein